MSCLFANLCIYVILILKLISSLVPISNFIQLHNSIFDMRVSFLRGHMGIEESAEMGEIFGSKYHPN